MYWVGIVQFPHPVIKIKLHWNPETDLTYPVKHVVQFEELLQILQFGIEELQKIQLENPIKELFR